MNEYPVYLEYTVIARKGFMAGISARVRRGFDTRQEAEQHQEKLVLDAEGIQVCENFRIVEKRS